LQHIAIGRFFSILEYKAQLYDRKVVKVEPKDTSKTCSNCGYVYHELKLSDKNFKCPKCGFRIDRDLNASINILKRGLELIAPSAGQVEYRREMARFIPCLYAESPSL
ncbi:MAG TPA: transposase, partial [Thermoplasmatales archaeon]|nr:transposase [Thermoplasmatales archaeon]